MQISVECTLQFKSLGSIITVYSGRMQLINQNMTVKTLHCSKTFQLQLNSALLNILLIK